MIYLDTNAFYYASGISNPDSIDIDLLKDYLCSRQIALPSAVLFEFISKYRNDNSIISTGLKFIDDYNAKIANNPIMRLPDDFRVLWDEKSSRIDDIFKSFISNKIDAEARLTTYIFCLNFSSAARFIVENKSKRNGISDAFCYCMKCFLKKLREAMVELFVKEYEVGYKDYECENYIRKRFDDYLGYFLYLLLPDLAEANEKELSNEEICMLDPEKWNEAAKNIEKKIQSVGSAVEYVKKNAHIYYKNSNDDHLKEYLCEMATVINKKDIPKAVNEYIIDIVESMFILGRSFYKNDILDAIIMSHIRGYNDVLITYDLDAYNHMKKNVSENKFYQKSIEVHKKLCASR